MTVDDRLLDAKIQASEAKTDSKFSAVMAELRILGTNVQAVSGKMDKFDGELNSLKTAAGELKGKIVSTGLVLGLTLGGLIIAIAAYGNQMLELAAGIFAAGGGVK